jgi:hypothetical protein
VGLGEPTVLRVNLRNIQMIPKFQSCSIVSRHGARGVTWNLVTSGGSCMNVI